MNDLGLIIRNYRKAKGMTQKQLASAIGVHTAAVSKYETNLISPSLDMIKKIANTLDVSLAVLLDTSLNPQEIIETPEGIKTKEMSVEEVNQFFKHIESQTQKKRLSEAFDQLNGDGQKIAVERVEELTEIPKYKK